MNQFCYFYVSKNTIIIGKKQKYNRKINQMVVDKLFMQVVRRFSGGGPCITVWKYLFLLHHRMMAITDFGRIHRNRLSLLIKIRTTGAELQGRNDLLTSTVKKYSGNAVFKQWRLTAHGTLCWFEWRNILHKYTSKTENRVKESSPFARNQYQALLSA